MTLPVLACCLMLALITSTLLVMFAADETGVPPASGNRSAASAGQGAGAHRATGRVGQPLPSAEMIMQSGTVPLRAVTASAPSVLALVPPGCGCAPTLRQLAAAAGPAHVRLYLVGKDGDMDQVSQLAALAGQSGRQVVTDMNNVLANVYSARGLTALLVHPGGTVSDIARDLSGPQDVVLLQGPLQQLGGASTGG